MSAGAGDATTGLGATARSVVVVVVAAAVVALVAAVGGPPGTDGTGTGSGGRTTAVPVAGVAVDQVRLTQWCQDLLASRDAEAVPSNDTWRCIGRAGGIWRRQPIQVPDLCRHLGFSGHSTAVSNEAIYCLA
jgi:hypothetical protein